MKLNFIKFFPILIFFMQCTTVDFIPDSDYNPKYPNYNKKDWEEVEIHFARPDKRISIQGQIKIRDFENSGTLQHYVNYIKKDMFAKKMDGVWIKQSKVQSVQDSIFQTMDSRGNITHSHEAETDMKIWTGYAFRDRK